MAEMKILCAAFGAAFFALTGCNPSAKAPTAEEDSAASQEKTDENSAVSNGNRDEVTIGAGELSTGLISALQQGGYVLVARHANSPGEQAAPSAVSEGCNLAPGRGLDDVGRQQAAAMGRFIAEKNIPVLKAYTSDMCRAWDTATAAIGDPVIPHPSQKTTDPEVIAQFKIEIEAELAANPGKNILLTSHSNIAPLYGAKPRQLEYELPSGVIYAVSPGSWRAVMRIDFRNGYDEIQVTVD